MFIVLAILTAVLPACESETSTNCYWDASEHGNGLGSSFIDVGGKVYDVPIH